MKEFIVIGCGKFGESIAKKLSERGMEVLAVDKDPEKVQSISEHVTHTVELDAMDETSLRSISIENFEVAIIAIGEDIQSSITVTYMAKEMGVKKIIAKAKNQVHANILYKLGADKVVFPEREMGSRIAYGLSIDNGLDYIEIDSKYSIIEITAYPNWIGKTIGELALAEKHEANLIAVKNNKKNCTNINPKDTDYINEGDMFIILGETIVLSELGEDI